MKKIKFEDLPSENTPINSANLDTLQDNIEESAVIVSSTEPQTKEKVWFQKSNNLLDNKATSQKINGITYTVNPDKTVTANGKATGMSILFLTESNATLEKGNYNITDGVGDYTNYFTQLNVNNPTQGEQFINTGFKYDCSISEKSKLGVKIIIRDGVTVNNLKFKPMLVKQENKNIPYEPYLTKKILTKTNGVFEEFYNEETVVKDTGWINIPLLPEFSNYAEWIPCQIRKIDNVVHLRGAVKGFTKINYTKFATIPEGFRPNENEQHVQNLLNSVKNLAILTVARNGNLEFTEIQYQPRNTEGILINCTWFTD